MLDGLWASLYARSGGVTMERSDVESYAAAWRARFQAAEQARANRAAVARALLPRLVQHLAERYGVRRIWLYGSLAEGGFHEHSNVDLAAEDFFWETWQRDPLHTMTLDLPGFRPRVIRADLELRLLELLIPRPCRPNRGTHPARWLPGAAPPTAPATSG
jgi:hypothetical protein